MAEKPEIVEGELVEEKRFTNAIKNHNRPLNRRDHEGNRILTSAEARLCRVMSDPNTANLNNRRKCEVAGISVNHFYKIMKDPWFRAQVRERIGVNLMSEANGIMKAAVNTAKMEGRNGHSDRKMLLEMMELAKDTRRVEHTGAGGGPIETETTVTHVFDRSKFERLFLERTRRALPGLGPTPGNDSEKPVGEGRPD